MEQTTELRTIPPELQLLITSYLSPPEKQLLRMTCRHFHNVLPPPSAQDIEAIVKSPYNYKYYEACLAPTCMRLYNDKNWRVLLRRRPPPGLNIRVFGCKACKTNRLPFSDRADDCEEYSKTIMEKSFLKRLRRKQGLGRGFWEIELVGSDCSRDPRSHDEYEKIWERCRGLGWRR